MLEISETACLYRDGVQTAKLTMLARAQLDSGRIELFVRGVDCEQSLVGSCEIMTPFLEGEVRALMAEMLRALADLISTRGAPKSA